MEETKQLEVIKNKSIFNKAVKSLSKLLFVPSQKGLYGIYISLKRREVLKTFDMYLKINEPENIEIKEEITKKYEKAYEAYMKTIDKYVIEYLYKRVVKRVANVQESNYLSEYYDVASLKEQEYMEYKYKKQQYLLKLDWDTVSVSKNQNLVNEYREFYCSKMEMLYKSLLKHYSVQLTDSHNQKETVYDSIFTNIKEYMQNILPYKIENDKKGQYKDILSQYNSLNMIDKYNLSEEQKYIKKNMILLNVSRNLFTHSLPLVAAEKCYVKLIKDARNLIVNSKDDMDREVVYKSFITLVEEFNCKLLSKKVYWDSPEAREDYKKFWNNYKEISNIEDKIEGHRQKEILFIKNDIELLKKSEKYTPQIKAFYIGKLKQLKALKQFKNSCVTRTGKFKKAIV